MKLKIAEINLGDLAPDRGQRGRSEHGVITPGIAQAPRQPLGRRRRSEIKRAVIGHVAVSEPVKRPAQPAEPREFARIDSKAADAATTTDIVGIGGKEIEAS